ncbi:hypothetical protein [Vitreoscilla filiformis]|uniref:hypothetical protein n=1 Tax=Vitreoscilla filiformis TaxID=63 RepID=UPI0012FD58A1|nr:hypothetical protein [Vitreoscilla filiformis]
MVKQWLPMLAVVFAGAASAAEGGGEKIEQALAQASSGTARFSHGMLISLGYNKQDNLQQIANSRFAEAGASGFEFSIGYSATFAPIRDWNEIEAGVGYKLALGSGGGADSTYETKVAAPFVYAGVLFPMANGAAMGVGVQLDFPSRISFNSQGSSSEPGFEIEGVKSKGRKLVYAEWQFGKESALANKSYFVRVGVGGFSYSTPSGDRTDKTAQISFGLKL